MAPLVQQLVQQDKRPCFRCQAKRACLSSCARDDVKQTPVGVRGFGARAGAGSENGPGETVRRRPFRTRKGPPRPVSHRGCAAVAAFGVKWSVSDSETAHFYGHAGHDPLVLEPALFNDARGFSRFAVSRFRFLRRQLITPRAAESARRRRATRLGLGGVDPWGGMDWPHPLSLIRPHPKIYPTKNPQGLPHRQPATEKARPHASGTRATRLPDFKVVAVRRARTSFPLGLYGSYLNAQPDWPCPSRRPWCLQSVLLRWMSDRRYPFSIHLIVDGNTFTGCCSTSTSQPVGSDLPPRSRT